LTASKAVAGRRRIAEIRGLIGAAPSLPLRPLQLRPIFANHDGIDRLLFRLSMNDQFESLGQQRLQHQPQFVVPLLCGRFKWNGAGCSNCLNIVSVAFDTPADRFFRIPDREIAAPALNASRMRTGMECFCENLPPANIAIHRARVIGLADFYGNHFERSGRAG